MARLCLAVICAIGALVLVPQAAAGGGWWSSIQLDRSHVAPGQRVELTAALTFTSAAAAERFHVYLLRGFDDSVVERAMRKASPGNWWSLGGADAIDVGDVTVSASDANFFTASAAFTVPELPLATYHLMLCDTGCAKPLGSVIPAEGFTVVADPVTAQLAQRVDRLKRRSRSQAQRLTRTRADADWALEMARRARSEVRHVEAAAQDRSSPPAAVRAGWLGVGALAGTWAVLVLRRRASGHRDLRQGSSAGA